jgi:hypothetical protein
VSSTALGAVLAKVVVGLAVAASAAGAAPAIANQLTETPDTAQIAAVQPAVAPTTSPALPDASTFGQQVANDARDGGADGQDISAQARANAALHHTADSHPRDSATAPGGASSSPGTAHATGHGKPTTTPGGRK